MAMAVTSQTLRDGPRNLVVHITGISDGNGDEDGVTKVDVSSYVPDISRVRIDRISGNVSFGLVKLLWNADIPVVFAALDGDIDICYDFPGGLQNEVGGSANGDILLSTEGFELNSAYDLTLTMVKKA